VTSPIEALSRDRAVLLVIDIQERLTAAMPESQATKMIANTRILIEAAGRLGVPIVVSQQYPKGLGPTVGAVEEALAAVQGTPVHRFDKLEFSAAAAPAFAQLPPSPGRDQWIVCGEETHVCVYQTVRDLVGHGPQVHVVADAVASRTKANWRVGIDLAARVGAVPTSTEVVVFDLLGKAGTDEFKSLSKIIK
jgi:nicotinamidase-related amidase